MQNVLRMDCVSFSPLIGRDSNAISPCFAALVIGSLSALTFTLGGIQLLAYSLSATHGSLLSKRPHDKMKRNIIFIHLALLYATVFKIFKVYQFNFISLAYASLLVVTTFIILPLHLIEMSKNHVQTASILLFWPMEFLILFIITVQQIFGSNEQKLIPIGGYWGLATLFMLLFTNIIVFQMELKFYKPNPELLNNMDMDGKIHLKDPNIISKMTFSWMNPLIELAHSNNGLESDDLPTPPKVVSTAHSAPRLAANWYKQSKKPKSKRSLIFALIKTFGFQTFICICFDMSESIISFVQPQLLKRLIQFFSLNNENQPMIVGFTIALGMFVVSITGTMLSNQAVIKTVETRFCAKAAMLQLVYNKAMGLSPSERMNRPTGDILNHMSVDINAVTNLVDNVQTMLSAPARFVLCLASLYGLLGNSTWVGLLTMCVMLPLNTLLVKKLKGYHVQQMKLKDKRTSFVSEILQNVKSIKLYAWETPMLNKLAHIRNDEELANLRKIGILSASINFAWTCVPFFVSCSTFAVFALFSGIPLTPDIIFPALSLFDLLSDPIFALPVVITALIQCSVSLNRLSSFLCADDVDTSIVTKLPKVKNVGDVSVEISNGTFLWKNPLDPSTTLGEEEESLDETRSEALINLNFKAKKGQLACIVGRVGSGKSTFLNCMLGEMPVVPHDKSKQTSIRIHGHVAYCSQIPWIINATVKENILFGHKMDPEFYAKAIDVCQLTPDLDILPDGDETLVGEKGISLSGGQKARLSLARAIYARADVYIFDDILSAVDAHVGENLINQVLGHNGILKSKTRILATNSIKVLNEASRIYLLENKQIAETGNLKSITSKGSGKLFDLIQEFGNNENSDMKKFNDPDIGIYNDLTDSDESIIGEDLIEPGEVNGVQPLGVTYDENTGSELAEFTHRLRRQKSHLTLDKASVASLKRIAKDGIKRKTAVDAERKEVGKVKWHVFLRYAEACSYSGIIITLSLVVLTAMTNIGSSYWLMNWSQHNVDKGANQDTMFYVGIYATLGIGSGFSTLLSAVSLWTLCSIRASKLLHSEMAQGVLRSPLSFFETTPLGRIINRFGQDMSKIDSALPRIFAALFGSFIKTAFTMIIICTAMPMFIVVIVILSFAYKYFQQYYVVIIRDLKRLSSITRSPIYAHIQESLNGAETVRAYGQFKRFSFMSDANIDLNQVTHYCVNSLNRWLSTRLQFIGSLIVLSTSCLSLTSLWTPSPLTAGVVGLIMSYALRVTSSLSFIVRRSVEVESDAVCCERIFEYCELPPESDESETNKFVEPKLGWPENGVLTFNNYSTRYRANLEPILKNITLSIASKEKIGIVGRTGAGKSSLVLSIFRIIEPINGDIEIDGIDTTKLKLNDLRKNLSIIPQDAQCIEGTIRYNLDPLDQYSDEQRWKAIKLAKLEEQVKTMAADQDLEDPLDSQISESGANLSVGQRQLVCLARVLLRAQQSKDLTLEPSKILILDEATSSVDAETDRIIQETIRSEFTDLTILTIAHRLETIMDNDKILVLERGEIAEFDTPANLLANENSQFYSLCVDGGYISKKKSFG